MIPLFVRPHKGNNYAIFISSLDKHHNRRLSVKITLIPNKITKNKKIGTVRECENYIHSKENYKKKKKKNREKTEEKWASRLKKWTFEKPDLHNEKEIVKECRCSSHQGSRTYIGIVIVFEEGGSIVILL